jgi:hypothetical protein
MVTNEQEILSHDGFVAPEELEATVLEQMRKDPAREWILTELAEMTGLPMIDVAVAATGLASSGQVEVRSPGRYQWTGRDPKRVRHDLARRLGPEPQELEEAS